MRIDLHTHSDRSDGTLAPREVVARAKELRLDVIALTDHDSFDGWDEAVVAAQEYGIGLVRGVEISCRYGGHGVHLLGYLPDPTYQPLLDELGRVLDGRNQRLPVAIARLQELGIAITMADVEAVSADAAAMGRPHIADALVNLGVVADRTEAFDTYLAAGRPGFVDRYATSLVDAIRLVAAAGGVSVLAHPWAKRHDTSALGRAGLEELKDAGLAGIEVDHQDHDAAARAGLRELGADLGLVMTGSSDFHGDGKVNHELGVNTTAPDQYERIIELAAAASASAGRRTPGVVGSV